MASLMNLLPDNILVLKNNKYKLLGKVGEGGSSIVYLAQPIDNLSKSRVMIKEFYPNKCNITRKTSSIFSRPFFVKIGSIIVPPNNKEKFNKLKKRAKHESRVAEILRNDHTDIVTSDDISKEKTNSPWILEYSKPIKANCTLYTIIETKSGETLESLIERKFFTDKDFIYLCDLILIILDAVFHMHSKGYLHLDIAPDNIFVPEYKPKFTELVHVHPIDYNSAIKKGIPLDDGLSFSKEGYSAPELDKSSIKPTELDYSTDLYSVAAIFFRLLVNRNLRGNDRGSSSEWKLSQSTKILEDAPIRLIDKTNQFLTKGIEKSPECRFQNVKEMREALEKLKTLKSKIVLVDNSKRPYAHFIGRDFELERIDELLNKDRYVILEGIGGIGKTELAKKYADKYSDQFDVFQIVRYVDDIPEDQELKKISGLQSTIIDSLKFHNFDTEKYKSAYKEKAFEKILEEKMKFLKENDEKTLIIIDNYNVSDDKYFEEFTSGKYKVIFTSRNKHNDDNTIEVDSMEDNDLIKLFRKYHDYDSVRLAKEDEPIVKEIIDLVLGHTMTVILIATTMHENALTAKEMLENLQNGLDHEKQIGITVKKEWLTTEERVQIMYGHIETLFNMKEFEDNTNYKFIMTNMAIVPYSGLSTKDFRNWALHEYYKNENSAKVEKSKDMEFLRELIKSRWIQQHIDNKNNRLISLHPVISDIVNDTLKPDSEKCLALIENMTKVAKESTNKTYVEWLNNLNQLELACKRIHDETEVTANLFNGYAELATILGRYEAAMSYYKKAVGIYEKILDNNHQKIANTYSYIAEILRLQNNHVNSRQWHDKALAIRKNISSDETVDIDIATSYHDIASIYRNRGDYGDFEESLVWHKKAHVIREKMLGKWHADTADSYNNMAYVYDRISVYSYNDQSNEQSINDEKALELYKEAIAIREKIKSLDIATSYNNIARIYRRKGEYDRAIELHQKSLHIREERYGKEHHVTARTYNSLAGTYFAQGDYTNALVYYNLSLSIREKQLGQNHSYTASTYHDMALLYNKREEYEKALEFYLKAFIVREKVFGENHQKTVMVRKNMEHNYNSIGQTAPFEDWLHDSLPQTQSI
ncbi:MAG: tetratricopeptide repeat protein [Oscillospiraceae bacterium]|nr:tetratricopeptide repeat protein [Oscillospiraceae bacterium]